jgi:hypothetical protein
MERLVKDLEYDYAVLLNEDSEIDEDDKRLCFDVQRAFLNCEPVQEYKIARVKEIWEKRDAVFLG